MTDGTTATELAYWKRHAREESWADIAWFPPIAGHHTRCGGRVNPDELAQTLSDLHVSDRWVPTIHPWPDKLAVDQAISRGKLVELAADSQFRITIAAQARDALTRDTGWGDPDPPETTLRVEAWHAGQYAVTGGFHAYLREGFRRYTALAVICMPYRPGLITGPRETVITLWDQVRSMALGAAAGERAWREAEVSATGIHPYDGP